VTKFIAVLIASSFLLETCKEKTNDVAGTPLAVRSVRISPAVSLGKEIEFEVTCGTPNPCWTFKRFDIVQDGFSYNVTVTAEYDGRPCIQILGSIKATSSVVPQKEGTYTFRFYQTQAASLDTTVVVR
jgi:hypothetical protein